MSKANMFFRPLFLLVIITSLFSCNKNNNTNNSKTTDIIAKSRFYYDEYRYLKVKNNIEGYYGAYGTRYIDDKYLARILIENENIIIYKFNIINEQYYYNEIIRFDINIFNANGSISFENIDYKFKVSFDYKDDFYSIYLNISNLYLSDLIAEITFIPISKDINDDVIKHTYDFQKQYVGIYYYDSYSYIGTGMDKNEIILKYLTENNKIVINIDEDGFLSIFDVGSRVSRMKNICGNGILFGHTYGYNQYTEIYFYENNIIKEDGFYQWDNEMKRGIQKLFIKK